MRAVIYSVVLLLNVSVSRPSVFSLFLVKVEVFVKTISVPSTFLNFALYIKLLNTQNGEVVTWIYEVDKMLLKCLIFHCMKKFKLWHRPMHLVCDPFPEVKL